MNWLGTIVRFVVSALVLMFVGFLVPGVSIASFWSAIVAAIVIAVLGWIAEAVMGRRANRYGRGVVGFIATAVVLWIAGLIVPGMRVTVLGALIASLVVGIIDLFIPVELGLDRRKA
ncbi:membrane protein [Alicyclobacillus contaminans]|uniref:phage holin family protein n=1 Tax=Alicyclobacillus contaminans TaxID=392016 RepID=UPI00041C283C|nr:phage holin family protein [Alicyclobacillus contaminans]GMA51460.1 membrane protein [Alicyclobacillus contaminans]